MHTDLYNRIRTEVGRIPIIDTHEHLFLPDQLEAMGRIDFGLLFSHYTNSDLVSAGMSQADVDAVVAMDSVLSPTEKWALVKQWYERTWNTAYCRSIRIAMRDLFGYDDLSDDTVGPLSERMNAVDRRKRTRQVFNRAGIEVALEQNLWLDSAYPKQAYPGIFLYDLADPFTTLNIDMLSRETGIEIGSLDDFLKAVDWHFDRFALRATAWKISRAYDRPIRFEETSRDAAERVFADLLVDRAETSGRRMLEDYICHYCIARCGEYHLPVKIHTGIQDGNRNDINNSRPGLVVNLLMKYPNVRFDLYHIGWPYSDELTAIAKVFPNVTTNFCWVWVISPSIGRRYLHQILETVPLNKIHGFGGDYFFVEGSYAHSVMARDGISQVLCEKIEEGWFTEEQAVHTAQRLLRDNVLDNFRIAEKRSL